MHTSLPLPPNHGTMTALAWDPCGLRLAAVSTTGMVFVWDVASQQVLFTRQLTRCRLLTVAWTAGGRAIALGGENRACMLVAASDGTLLFSEVFERPVTHIAVAPRHGRVLIATGTTLYVYGERSASGRLTLASPLLDVAWSPTGGRFALVCQHGEVLVYSVARKRPVYTLCDLALPQAVAWNPNGRDLAIATALGTIQFHDGSTGEHYTTYALSQTAIMELAWGNPWLATRDASSRVAIWDLLPREQSYELLGRSAPIFQTMAFSPDGEWVAAGARGGISLAIADQVGAPSTESFAPI